MNKQQRTGLAIGGGFMSLLFILLMYFVFRTPPPPPVDPVKARAADKMRLARIAITDERFDDAINFIEVAERLVPGIDEDGLMAATKKEIAARKSLETAKSLLEQQRWDDARAELTRTPEASPKVADEREKLNKQLDEREAQYHEKNLDDALAASDLPAAQRELEALPPERQAPYATRMAELEAAIQAAAAQQRPPGVVKRNPDGDRPPRTGTGTPTRGRNTDSYFMAVNRKFQGQDYDRAVMECDRVLEASAESDVRTRAEGLKRLIPGFQRAFEDGLRKSQAGAKESALRPLQKAHDLYQQIGFTGGLGDAMDEMLLESLLASARASVARGDIASAAIHYREAQKLDGRNEAAATGIKMVSAKAEEMYGQAYADKDVDPASFNQKMRIIMEIVPKGSETYRKAAAALGLKQTKGREVAGGRR